MRDYTDYFVVVRRSDKPIHAYWHYRNTPTGGLKVEAFRYHGHRYRVDKDWLIHLKKYRPWRLWDDAHKDNDGFKLRRVFKYLNEWSRSKRIGMLLYNEPSAKPEELNLGPDLTVSMEEPIEPVHIARIPGPDPEKDKVTSRTTPRVLRSIVDANHYKLSWRSIKFGVGSTIKSRWLLFVILGIIGVVLLLYFTGNIPMGGQNAP